MGELDRRCIEYFSDAARFADVMNLGLYDGNKIIKPNELQEVDSTFVMHPEHPGKNGKSKRRATVVDKAMLWNGVCLRILFQEYQSYVDTGMPVRCMISESAAYDKQIKAIKRRHRVAKDLQTTDEYLSGMKYGEKLVPVITLVVSFAEKKWYGPKSLHEMLCDRSPEIIRFVSDHRINILDYHDYDSFDKMDTQARKIFEVLKNRDDNERMKALVSKDKTYSYIDEETADFIGILTNLTIKKDEKGGFDMCKAIMMERAEGIAEGIALINALYNRLVLADRIDDMKRAATDRTFQEQLMEEIIPDLLHRDEEVKTTGAF